MRKYKMTTFTYLNSEIIDVNENDQKELANTSVLVNLTFKDKTYTVSLQPKTNYNFKLVSDLGLYEYDSLYSELKEVMTREEREEFEDFINDLIDEKIQAIYDEYLEENNFDI